MAICLKDIIFCGSLKRKKPHFSRQWQHPALLNPIFPLSIPIPYRLELCDIHGGRRDDGLDRYAGPPRGRSGSTIDLRPCDFLQRSIGYNYGILS